MRKRLLAALLVLMMLVSIVPLAVSAEEECTEHSFVQDDYYGHVCESCGTYGDHVDADGDCVCDVCGGACHGLYYYIVYSDENGHWHVCGNCGETVSESGHVDEMIYTYTAMLFETADGESAYSFYSGMRAGSDGVCDECGYGCTHSETATATGGSFCFEYCIRCAEILTILCADENGDCVCDVNGHEYHADSYYESDESGHGNVCRNCGEKFDFSAHVDEVTYTWTVSAIDGLYYAKQVTQDGSDGVCDICSYGCQHANTAIATGGSSCFEYCTSCGQLLDTDLCVDEDGDGICDNCGGIMNNTGTVTTSTSGTVASSVTVDTSALLTEDDAMLIIEGYDVEIVLSVDEMTSSADSALILSAAGDNVVGVSYLDIDLTKMIYDTEGMVWDQEAMTDLSTPVTITVAIPQSLLDSVGTTTGTYSVVRVHDGVATVLATSYDSTAKTVTFTTDRFSTYGIVFTASTNTNTGLDDVPQTGDSSLILVGLALMMAAVPVVKKFVF